ncbi:MAG: hypothetical protein NVSMB46_07830 [Candidatus Saccharimonadales bacterium]
MESIAYGYLMENNISSEENKNPISDIHAAENTTSNNEVTSINTTASEPSSPAVTESTPIKESVPDNPPVNQPSLAAVPSAKRGNKVLSILIGILLLLIGLGAGYGIGHYVLKQKDEHALSAPAVNADKQLILPTDAVLVSECAKGRGKQYALPSDIPHGPVYNVLNDKVIGIEYMIGKDELIGGKSFLNLPLQNIKYDHVNIGLLSTGHAGYPQPHYHVDIFNISNDIASKITCEK